MKKLLILSLTLFIGMGAFAQQTKKKTIKKSTTKKPAPAKNIDNGFILNAINGDLMEIELGGYAEKYAADERVKTFGSNMVRDHRRTKIELKSIASQNNLTVSDAMDAKHKARVDAIEKKKGADFDKQYIDMMVNDHANDLSEFRRLRTQVRNADLKKFMPRAIALLETHLSAAKEIQATLKGTGK